MGTKPIDLAIALDIERESYYRLEREPWRLSLGEVEILATEIGVTPSQFRFPPPKTQAEETRISLDDLLNDVPDDVQAMAIKAVRAMIGR